MKTAAQPDSATRSCTSCGGSDNRAAAAVDEEVKTGSRSRLTGSSPAAQIQAQVRPSLDGRSDSSTPDKIDRHGRLQIGQHASRVGHEQRLDGGSAAVQHVQIGLGS